MPAVEAAGLNLRDGSGVVVWDQKAAQLTITHVDGKPIVDGGPAIDVAHGQVKLVGGQLVFTPNENYSGETSYTYTISDGLSSSTATVRGYVHAVNDAPIAGNDSFVVDEDGRVTIDVLANDQDIDGDRLTVTAVDGKAIVEGSSVAVSNGTVTLTDGKLVFVPTTDANGSASFSYTLSDGKLTTVATVNGTITAVNDAPVAANDSFVVDEDGRITIDVLANDQDIDGDRLTVTAVDGQAIVEGGSVAVSNGTVTLTDGKLVFVPAADANGSASFSYTLSDGEQITVATVNGTISAVNDTPVAANDSFVVDEDGRVTIDVLANDQDIDGDRLTETAVDGKAIVEGGSVAVSNGTVTLTDGKLVFVPTTDANGSASFSYTLSDGKLTTVATVNGTISAVNDTPVAANDSFVVDEDGRVTIDVLANDQDIDGDRLTVTAVDGKAIVEGSSVAVSNGTVTLTDGKLVFVPTTDANGSASFSYTLSDGKLTTVATVNGTITAVNDAPVAANDRFVVDEDGRVTIDVLANDQDIDGDRLTVTAVDGKAIVEGGSVTVGNGTVTLTDGKLVFVPTTDANGSASFSYTLSDGKLTTVATVNGTITAVNDAPVAANDSFVVDEDGRVAIDVLANDQDIDGDRLTVTAVDGKAIVEGGLVAVSNGTVTLTDGRLVFVPTADANGPASFSYTLSDGKLTTVATVNGTITAVNDAPVAANDSFVVNEDGRVTIDVLANDQDIDGDRLTVTAVDGKAISEGSSVAVSNGTVTLTDGKLVFVPTTDANGSASFSYTLSDGKLTTVATDNGTISAVNDTPVAGNDSFVVNEDGRVTIDVLANDQDIDGDRLTVTAVDGQAIVEGGSVGVENGTVTLTDGKLVFVPTADANGPASFSYTLSDGKQTTVATVNGTITAVNDAPVAVDDSFVVNEDGRVTIDVLANDYDVDGGALSVVAVNGQSIVDGGHPVAVANGNVVLQDGKLVFIASPNAVGASTFTYSLSGGAQTSVATVNGVITPLPPVVASTDTVLGPGEKALILTGSAPIRATGNALDNAIGGNDGNNYIDGGPGNDTLAGGRGDDVYVVDSLNDTVRELSSQGNDEVRASVSFALPENVERLTLTGNGHIAGFGNDLANTLTGNSGNNLLVGGGGNDVVVGGAGDDAIAGGSGNDTLSGQDGNDVIYGEEGADFVNGGAGSDELDGGVGNDGLYGGGGNDRISGGLGNDALFGDGGNDTLRGGPGNDTLTGGQGQDTFVWLRGDVIDATGNSAGLDRITDFGVGDRLDFSGLFSAPPLVPISDLIRVEDTLAGTLVSVDINQDGQFWDTVTLADVHDLSVDTLLQNHSVSV